VSGIGEAKFLIAATLFHVVALPGAAAIAPSPSNASAAIVGDDISEIDVDLDSALLPPRPDDREVDDVMPMDSDARVAAVDPRTQVADPRQPGSVDPATSDTDAGQLPYDPGEVVTAPENADGVDDEYARPPSYGDIHGRPGMPGIPGLPGEGPPTWAPGVLAPIGPYDRAPAPTKAPKRKYDKDAATRVVQDGLREKDRKLGLDFPGRGPIRNAFLGAVYSAGVPHVSSASFSLSVSPSGKVTNVSLLGFSGGSASSWKLVQSTAKGSLASVKLVMRSAFAKGANVGVSVRSLQKTPGGGTGREGATFSFDVADIGAKEQRVVTAFVNPQPVK
jgi:hypothetical protein